MFIYFEKERESQAGSPRSAQSPPDTGLRSTNREIVKQAETHGWTFNRLSPPGRLKFLVTFKILPSYLRKKIRPFIQKLATCL